MPKNQPKAKFSYPTENGVEVNQELIKACLSGPGADQPKG
jgi:hypothetical protein